MDITDRFERFAADFEAAVQDDDWSRLEQHLAQHATYSNIGGPDPACEGRTAVIDYLKTDVSNTDRRFDSRTLVALTPPAATDNRLSRQWRCTYTLAGTPDLVVEGEARYLFEDGLIKTIEEEPTTDSMQKLGEWMQEYGNRLHAPHDQSQSL
jgi:hypothetical protein